MTTQRPTLATIALILSLAWFPPGLDANPVVARAAKSIVKSALRQSGHGVFDRVSREAAEKVVAQSIRRIGREETERLIQLGGVDLLKAAARSGDEVLEVVRRVPEAAKYVVHNSDEALVLANRWGDDALKLEARVPGAAQSAATQFGKSELSHLATRNPEEVIQVLAYAKHADSPATRKAMYDSWKKNGASFLDTLNQSKALILTGGLTLAMVKVANGVEEGVEKIPDLVPSDSMGKAAESFGEGAATGFRNILTLIPLVIGAILIFRTRLRRSRQKTPS